MNIRPTSFIYAVYFVLILTVVPVVSLSRSLFDEGGFSFEVDSERSLLDGSYSKSFESYFDRNLSFYDLAVSVMAAIHYFVFSEGSGGVVVGKDDWLFSTEEIDLPANSAANLEKNLAIIASVSEFLDAQDITLVITPVPAKVRVFRQQLAGAWPQSRDDVYRYLLESLQHSGVHVVDTYAGMNAAASSQSLFFRSDTHWTPTGASIIAQATADYWRSEVGATSTDLTFSTEAQAVQKLEGDLMSFIPLAPWFSSWGPTPEYFRPSQTYAQASDLFASTEINTLLVGTSYSADERWNFAGFLKQALGRDLANYSAKGLGPYRPMYELLTDISVFDGVDLVVWEIPERYLMDSYSELKFSQLLSRNADTQLAAAGLTVSPTN